MGLVIFCVAITMLIIGAAVGRFSVTRSNSKAQLNSKERLELDSLRDLTDRLMDSALTRIEIDPFAMTTVDEIRQYQRKALER